MDSAFRKFHAYRHLADQGRVPHISCNYDDLPLVSRLGPGDTLVLWCPACDTITTPSLGTWKGIEASLEENGKL